MRKVLFTVIAIVVAAGAFFVQDYLLQNDEEGTVTIVIVDELDETTTWNDVSFTKDDTLLGLLEDRFTLYCADNNYNPTTCDNPGMMGHVLLVIDDVTTDWTTNYIAIATRIFP